MENKYLYFGSVALFLALFMFITAMSVNKHESIHKAIFEDNGCQNVLVRYEWFGFNGYTSCQDSNFIYTQQTNEMNEWNEIVGYNVYILQTIIFIVGFMIYIAIIVL